MKRRQPPAPPVDEAARPGPFDYQRWADEAEPVPFWWTDTAAVYHRLAARQRWMDALSAWAARHGTDAWTLQNPHWHTHGHTGASCPVPPDPRCQP